MSLILLFCRHSNNCWVIVTFCLLLRKHFHRVFITHLYFWLTKEEKHAYLVWSTYQSITWCIACFFLTCQFKKQLNFCIWVKTNWFHKIKSDSFLLGILSSHKQSITPTPIWPIVVQTPRIPVLFKSVTTKSKPFCFNGLELFFTKPTIFGNKS